jgi:hypothetical protein
MKLFGVRDIGSNVLKNTSETCPWDDLSCERPVGHKLHVKNSCGRANQTSSPPVMSNSTNGSKSSKMEAFYKRHGFPATKASKLEVMQEPDESQEPEIGAVVPVEGGCALNKSYTMSESEEDEGEGSRRCGRRCWACGSACGCGCSCGCGS